MEYTIRSVPEEVDLAFRARAKAEGKTLNDLAIEALAQRAGVVPKVGAKKRDLSFMRMHPDDVKAIREAHDMCDQVNEEGW